MQASSGSFCPYAFHHIMVEPTGEVRPCCRFHEADPGWNSSAQLKDVFNSPLLRQVREKMSAGQVVSGCKNCHAEEALAIPSMRERAFNTPLLDTTAESYLTYMEIAVGRVCNLKCRTCDARYSTKWEADEIALGKKIQHHTHDWLENLEIHYKDFARVRALKITGGEPLLAKSLPRFFNQLIELGLAPQIELQFYTNTTIRPPAELLRQLEQFRQVHLYMSVDGCGAVNEYLRNPSRWSEMQKVVAEWLQWQETRTNVRSSFAFTLSVVNLLSIPEFLRWRETLSPKPSLTMQIVHWPRALSLTNLDSSMKEILWSELKKGLTIEHDAPVDRALDTIQRILHKPALGRTTTAAEFYAEVGRLDKLRDEDFRKTFPELNRILENGWQI